MNRYLEQLKAWYDALDLRGRRMLFGAIGSAVLATAAAGAWSSYVPYSVLLSGRDYEELLEAAAALENAEISYKIVGVDSLTVPADQLGKARAAVASRQALPGLKDVDDLKLGLTPQAQQWAFLRAREGDIARMINGIEGISASQVSIVPREESLYLGEERPASASVFVKMRPGATIGQAQIRAMVNLVSSSVESLAADRITIADDKGNLLASKDDQVGDLDATAPSSLLGYRAEVERRYIKSVTQALQPVLGFSDGFSVTAAVDLDLTSRETVTKQVDAGKQAVLSEQLEESSNAKKTPSGVPGVDANLPDRSSASGSNAQSSNQSATTASYTYPTVDEIARRPAGGIQRLSVAVQIDERRLAGLIESGAAQGRDVETLKRDITKTVEAAVGYDPSRKDIVSVTFLPFAEPLWTEGTQAGAVTVTSMAQSSLPYAVAALALVLLFSYVVRPIMLIVAPPPLPKELPNEELEGPPRPVVELAEDAGPREEDDLASRLRLLVDNFQSVDATDLNRLVERQAVNAAEVVRKWNAQKIR